MFVLRPIIRSSGFLDWDEPIMNPLDDLFSPHNKASVSRVHDQLLESFSSDHGLLARRLEGCKVEKIELCKCAGGFQHEFLIVTTRHLFDELSSTARFLVIERDSNPENLSQTADAGFDSSQSSSNLNSASSQPNFVNPAIDTIKLFSKRDHALKSGARSCWTLTFAGGQIVDANNLFSAAVTVHRAAPNHSLVQMMSYWFAHNLLRVLASGRRYEITTTGATTNVTPGYFYGIPILNSLGKVKDNLPEQFIKEMGTRSEKNSIKNFFKGRSDKPAAYQSDADTTTASLSSEPKRQFIASEVVAQYHKDAQAVDQEIAKLVSDHADDYFKQRQAKAEGPETVALKSQVRELTKQVASEKEARLASEREACLASEKQMASEKQIEEMRREMEETRREMQLLKRSQGEGSNV